MFFTPINKLKRKVGRPKTGKTTTKATIYKIDRELINKYALGLGISVNKLIHRVFRHQDFESYLEQIHKD